MKRLLFFLKLLPIVLLIGVNFWRCGAAANEFDEVAQKLILDIFNKVGGVAGPENQKIKVAIRPLNDEDSPLPPIVVRNYNTKLEGALLKANNGKLTLVARKELNEIIKEKTELGGKGIEDLLKKAGADVLIVPNIKFFDSSEPLKLTYKAVKINTGEFISVSPAIKIPSSRLSPPLDVVSAKAAISRAAKFFKNHAPDLEELRLCGVHYQDSKIHTEFGLWLQKKLGQATSREFLNMLTGRGIKLRETGCTPISLLKTSKDIKPGTYQLTGQYWILGKNVDVNFMLQSTKKTVPHESTILLQTISPSISLKPRGDFRDLRSSDNQGPIRFSMSTEKGSNPRYKIGEYLHLNIKTRQDAWLYCFYVQADRNIYKIFPNEASPNAKIVAKKPYSFPGDSKFDIQFSEPVGVELIKCFAMTRNVDRELPNELLKLHWGKDKDGNLRVNPLPRGYDRKLIGAFRNIRNVGISEKSVVVTVTR